MRGILGGLQREYLSFLPPRGIAFYADHGKDNGTIHRLQ